MKVTHAEGLILPFPVGPLEKVWMILKSRLGASHRAFAILTVCLLPACGGGVGEIVAIASIVTPLGGLWENVPNDEFLTFTGPPTETVMFASKLDVTASVTTSTNVCGGGTSGNSVDLEGTVENGNLVLRPVGAPAATSCLQGKFTDLRTLEATPTGQPTRVYRNGRVDVQMGLGLWVSDGSGQLKLKFVDPDSVNNDDTASVTGCDVSVGSTKFVGDMNGFNTSTNAKPTIPELRSDDPANVVLFTQVVFVDGATLTLVNPASQAMTLHRKPDTTTTCPP
jgi:hypothetical protein